MDTVFVDLLSDPLYRGVLAVVLGLVIGSFLNVVIVRLPRMLEAQWRSDCEEYLQSLADHASNAHAPQASTATGEDGTDRAQPESSAGSAPERSGSVYNLAHPASHCPSCGHRIRVWENIPILSYVVLRGRCAGCKAPIGMRYPAVEAATALLTLLVVLEFGLSMQAALALPLTWALIALAVIDLDHQLLPDAITLPGVWAGLLISLGAVWATPAESILGAVLGYGILRLVYEIFRLLTGKEGMGFGDFKLLALFGAWLGWQALPMIILLSSLVGALVGIAMIALLRWDRARPIPFGPFLAAAGWIALIWGDQLRASYALLASPTVG